MIEKECQFCNGKFTVTESAEKKRIRQFGVGAKFCSRECMGKYKSAQYDHPSIYRNCKKCSNSFTVEKPCKKTLFCSRQCANDYRVAENEKERQIIIPDIKEYRKTHSVAETADQFAMSPSGLCQWGIIGPATEKRLACPNDLTTEQHEVLLGNLLGDGSLRYLKIGTNQQSSFVISQKLDSSEYIKGLKEIYAPFSIGYHEGDSKKPSRVDGKICHALEHWGGEYCHWCKLYTVAHPIFTNYRIKWYKDPYMKKSQKIIPADLRLTWRTAAILMCDDGSNHCSTIHRHRFCTLYTDCFTELDVEFLIDCFQKDLDIRGHLVRHSGKPTINIYGDEWFKFIENIKPFIPWQCFQYKIVNREKHSRNTSGFVGVTKYRNKWVAFKAFRNNGIFKSNYIGSFDTPEEAFAARCQWIDDNTNKSTETSALLEKNLDFV